jgi:hypothetical protein
MYGPAAVERLRGVAGLFVVVVVVLGVGVHLGRSVDRPKASCHCTCR